MKQTVKLELNPFDSLEDKQNAYRAAFDNVNGQKVLADLKIMAEIYTSGAHDPASRLSPFRADPIATAYTIGKQDIIHSIESILNAEVTHD